jgi:Fe-S-cluster-containing hydrogenase component 2
MSIEISSACMKANHQWSTCRACAEVCPATVISIGEHGAEVSSVECVDCGQCVVACPVEAIKGCSPRRRLNETLLHSDNSPAPMPKELLLFYADGVTGVVVSSAHTQWLVVVGEVNSILQEMKLAPLTIEARPDEPKEQLSASRRSFLRLSHDLDGSAKASIKTRALSVAYPAYQFFDIEIDTGTCSRCGACAGVCPKKCIRFGPDGIQIAQSQCTGCFLCRDVCVSHSIDLTSNVAAGFSKLYGYSQRHCISCDDTYFAFNEDDLGETAGKCQACLFREKMGISHHTIGQCSIVD